MSYDRHPSAKEASRSASTHGPSPQRHQFVRSSGPYAYGGTEEEQEVLEASEPSQHRCPLPAMDDDSGTGSGRHPDIDHLDHVYHHPHYDSTDQPGRTLRRAHQDLLAYNNDGRFTGNWSPFSTGRDSSPARDPSRRPHLTVFTYPLLPLRASSTRIDSLPFQSYAWERSSSSPSVRSLTSIPVPRLSSRLLRQELESAHDATISTSRLSSGDSQSVPRHTSSTTSNRPLRPSLFQLNNSYYSAQRRSSPHMSLPDGDSLKGVGPMCNHYTSTDNHGYEQGESSRSFIPHPSSRSGDGHDECPLIPSTPNASAECPAHIEIEINSPLESPRQTHGLGMKWHRVDVNK